MALVGQTITVVNKSGKIVSTSKHLVNIFKEAKSAYLERKAEIRCSGEGNAQPRREISLPPRPLITYESEDRSQSGHHSSHRTQRKRRSQDDRKAVASKIYPKAGRRHSESTYAKELNRAAAEVHEVAPSRRQECRAGGKTERSELMRRHSDSENLLASPVSKSKTGQPSVSVAEVQADEVDMDLAYGELPPTMPQTRAEDEAVMRNKIFTVNRMLEELNCLQFSASRIIKSLEANPEAMAAVALTLAEISNLASRLAPGALTSLKGSFPAVVALLASPEFLIAAGVGVGITIVALGGYKIIKKIRPAPIEAAPQPAAPQLAAPQPAALEQLMTGDIDRIEHWRHGIAASEAESVGTSVEGELMTPMAATRLREEQVLPNQRSSTRMREKFRKSAAPSSRSVTSTTKSAVDKDKKRTQRHVRDEQDTQGIVESKSDHSHRHRKSKSEAGSAKSERGSSRENSRLVKRTEPSGLRLLFKKQ